jgi:phosphoribosylanthranilate isomerase
LNPGSRPWIKICGVRRPEDAELAVALGATMIGLNFWPGSPRRVEPGAAREIAAAVGGRALRVGVFVDADPGRIEETMAAVGLDLVQLHGDEPDATVARFGERAIRARRSVAGPVRGAPAVFAYLLDAPAGGGYGGTGRSWDWGTARPFVAASPAPVLVAGGVAPGRAARALAESGAAGIDVASGVESEPGVKDPEKMERLFEEVRRGRR